MERIVRNTQIQHFASFHRTDNITFMIEAMPKSCKKKTLSEELSDCEGEKVRRSHDNFPKPSFASSISRPR